MTAVTPVRATQAGVESWLDGANALTKPSGRGASPRSEDMDELGYLAAWRCQFSGCGKDLQKHTSTGVMSKSSYFAHIIASSPRGPRGDPLLSEQRSADIDNF